MPFTFDYLDGDVLRWSATDGGATYERDESFTPTVYASAHGDGSLSELESVVGRHPAVEDVAVVEKRVSFRHDPEPVVRLCLDGLPAVTRLARTVSRWGDPGEYRLYDVDRSREFRYCLQEDVDPTPSRELREMHLRVPETQLAADAVAAMRVDGERVEGSPASVLCELADRIADEDPDVLFLNTGEIVPTLHEQADRLDVTEFRMGRLPGWQRLAGESTYESYGRVGHSPARYNLPGRVVVDTSNTFLWNRTNLDGCLDLVERSRKPLQELSWSSIGNVLTAIQTREARARGVLVPWRSWRHERFKTMRQLHEADRGGFTFSPAVGLHEDVHELDFASLYPNIIVTRNVSPERIRCECHAGREDVPGLGYAICDERGYLPDVLEPLVEDRDAIKAEIRETDDPERVEELEGRSSAIKWILVSCFGYQGFSNAKFGRIECHEAINAFAREILLDAKETLEANGWRVVHGIVDSVWVTPADGEERTPLDELAAEISERVAIRLEYEAAYDWIAFVPRRDSEAGALTKYFGKVADEGGYKYRGVECRQRSTPPLVANAQEELVETLAETRDPEAVCERLRSWIDRVRRGDAEPSDLVVRNRVSKSREAYTRYTRNVAALERASDRGLSRSPGQDVAYVVVDDDERSRERVALADEEIDGYDVDYYRERLVRAAESVLSPVGWREAEIEAYLAEFRDGSLQSWVG